MNKILLFIIAFLVNILKCSDHNFIDCLGADKKVIYFANNESKPVPQERPVVIMIGGYSTQLVMNYGAWIFMKEKLGMDVEFYPGQDPDPLVSWARPEWWNGDAPYPEIYWWWLANDRVDLNFEYWIGQGPAAAPFYADGSAVDGGFVGTYGDVGFWVPEWFQNEYDNIQEPKTYATDTTLQAMMRDGPKNGTIQNRTLTANALKKYQKRLMNTTGCVVIENDPVTSTCDGDACELYGYYYITSGWNTTMCSMSISGIAKQFECIMYDNQYTDANGVIIGSKAYIPEYYMTLNCTVNPAIMYGTDCVYITETPNVGYGIISSNGNIVMCSSVVDNVGTSCVDISGTTNDYVYLGNTHTVLNGSSCGILNGTQTQYTTGDWYEYFHTSVWDVTYGTQYGEPDGTKPVVWGSSDGYVQSVIANKLTNNVLGSDTWEFASTSSGSEGDLISMVADLYSRRIPFVANIYTPDDSFATTDPVSGNLQDFIKIAFGRNKEQRSEDPCYQAGYCAYPLSPLKKSANPRLKNLDRFPEAFQFFLTYQLPATQHALLMNYYLTHTLNTSMTEKERWEQASCDWLKNPSSATVWNNSNWLIDVIRYDCLNGCGVVKPGTSGNDVDNDYFGGTCNYHTGECTCDDSKLFNTNGRTCNESCPGLIGPYMNSNDTWEFQYCSNNGICNELTEECTCNIGYSGLGCERAYQNYKFPVGLLIVYAIFSGIIIITLIYCIFWLRTNAQYKTVKALSIDMTTLMTFGLIFLALSNIFLIIPSTSFSCIAWQFLFGLGGILAIMSPLLKAYRVSRVFHGGKMLRAVKITDKMLMSTLLKAAALELLICVFYAISHELLGENGIETVYNHDNETIEKKCNDGVASRYAKLSSFAYFGIVLCALTYYSYGTRRALSVFKESTCAYFSSFLAMFCTLITLVFNMATDDITFRNGVFVAAVIIVEFAVIIMFYGVRIYTFYTEPENRNVTDVRASTANSKSFTNNNSVMKPGPQSKA